jgi:hypothetical protein
MAFGLRKDEPIGKGLRRVVRKELRSAIDQLRSEQSDNEGIHEARKSIKKVRAVLQLVGDEVKAGRARKRLQKANHLLSPLRDADVLIETAHNLCSQDAGVSAKACDAIGSELAAEKTRLQRDAHGTQTRSEAADILDRVRRSAGKWQWREAGFAVFADEIRRTYKEARQRMQDARTRNDGDAFHDWRKRVKTFWYALRLLKKRVHGLDRPLADLKRLETELGDDHNLHVLQTQLERTQSPGGAWSGRARMRALSERRQRELRRAALSRGERLFALSPKTLARRLRKTWKTRGTNRRSRTVA